MTKSEIVDAYVRGEMDRRAFVTRLMAVGVSAGAAIAYAASLAPAAGAAGPRHSVAGYIARAQQNPDGEYGTAITLTSDDEGIQDLLAASDAVDVLFDALDSFTADDFRNAGLTADDLALLQKIRDQHAEQVDAIRALTSGSGTTSTSGGGGNSGANTSSLTKYLKALADAQNTFVGVLAAVIPAIQSGEIRQTLTQIGLVAARHAAIISDLAGEDPSPDSLENVIDPATL